MMFWDIIFCESYGIALDFLKTCLESKSWLILIASVLLAADTQSISLRCIKRSQKG